MADKISVQRGPKDVWVKVRNVTRTMTTSTQVATLPRGSRILYFMISGTASNAGTTATLSVGSTSANANEFVNAQDVKTAATGAGVVLMNGVAGAVGSGPGSPSTADTPIFVKYAETGGASSSGGWKLYIFFTAGNSTNDDTI